MPPKKLQKVALGKFRGEGLEAHALAGTAYRGSSCAQNTLHELGPELKSKKKSMSRMRRRRTGRRDCWTRRRGGMRYRQEGVAKKSGSLQSVGPCIRLRGPAAYQTYIVNQIWPARGARGAKRISFHIDMSTLLAELPFDHQIWTIRV